MEKRKSGPRPGTKYPHLWASGPDPVKHKKYLIWLQQRNQAQWRGEQWDLDVDTWIEIWGDKWDQRGRSREQLCMTRVDSSEPWNKDNVYLTTRSEHARTHAAKAHDKRKK